MSLNKQAFFDFKKVMVKVMYVMTLFEIEVKKKNFINVRQYLDNECSVKLETLGKAWIYKNFSHLYTKSY